MKRTVVTLLIVLACSAVLAGGYRLLMWAQAEARMSTAHGRLFQTWLALQTYHEVEEAYPPTIVYDENGRPMHSWRVLILPYFEGEKMYEQYRFDEPWNSEHNRALGESFPNQSIGYRTPNDADAPPGDTSIVAVIASQGDRPGAEPIITEAMQDQLKIVLLELPKSGIHWMEPKDIDANAAISRLVAKSTGEDPVAFRMAAWDCFGVIDGGRVTWSSLSAGDQLRPWFP